MMGIYPSKEGKTQWEINYWEMREKLEKTEMKLSEVNRDLGVEKHYNKIIQKEVYDLRKEIWYIGIKEKKELQMKICQTWTLRNMCMFKIGTCAVQSISKNGDYRRSDSYQLHSYNDPPDHIKVEIVELIAHMRTINAFTTMNLYDDYRSKENIDPKKPPLIIEPHPHFYWNDEAEDEDEEEN